MPHPELEWWYETSVSLAEKEEEDMKSANSKGRRR